MGATDLRVTFRQKTDTVYHVTCELDDGRSATSTFIVPMADDELAAAVELLSHTRSEIERRAAAVATTDPSAAGDDGRPLTRDARVEAPPEHRATAEDLGTQLYEALVDDDVRTLFDEIRPHGGARIRLVMDADQTGLMGIPWEFLCRDGLFLAAQLDTPIVRELATPNSPPPFSPPDRIRMLGAISSPAGLAPLDVDEERRRVEDSVAGFADAIEIEWIDTCTYHELSDAIERFQPHILHFVGHSGFADGTASIALCDSAGLVKHISATAFANLIGTAPGLRVVVLNSCEGARTGAEDPFTGLATKLLEQGRSAVVAMQFEITDDAACMFAEKFYSALVRDRRPIDQAVAAARKAVMGVNEVEFATPVLFLPTSETSDVFRFPRPDEVDEVGRDDEVDATDATDATDRAGSPIPAAAAPRAVATSAPPPAPWSASQEVAAAPAVDEQPATPVARPAHTATERDRAAPPASGRSRTLLWAGLVLAVIVLGAVGIAVTTGGDPEPVAPLDEPAGPDGAELETFPDEPTVADDCVASPAFASAAGLPLDDFTFDDLDVALVGCFEALENGAWSADPAVESMVERRLFLIDDALADGLLSEREHDAIVADAPAQRDEAAAALAP